MRAACLIEEVQRLLDRQSGLYSVYADAIQKYKQNKDATAFANARKKLDGDYRAISNQISQVQASLSKEQPEAAEKVRAKLLVASDTKTFGTFLYAKASTRDVGFIFKFSTHALTSFRHVTLLGWNVNFA